jgi:hypothetical protein
MFWRNILVPSSGSKSKPRKTPARGKALVATCFLLVPCFIYSLAQKMEVICSSEIMVDFYQTTWHYNAEDTSLYYNIIYNLKNSGQTVIIFSMKQKMSGLLLKISAYDLQYVSFKITVGADWFWFMQQNSLDVSLRTNGSENQAEENLSGENLNTVGSLRLNIKWGRTLNHRILNGGSTVFIVNVGSPAHSSKIVFTSSPKLI